ncbi:MAG: hypothetical protein Q8N36_06285 [bacterium]|nr:hypothetical protein [bacterium]
MGVRLYEILCATGLPVAYSQFGSTPPTLPYIVYFAEGSDNFAADNVVYLPRTNYQVELYSSRKDTTVEALVEAALTANEIFYEKQETWIASEKLYQVVYEMQIQGR